MKKLAQFLAVFLFAMLAMGHAFAADDYRLGEGDVIHVAVYDHPDLTIDLQVSTDGHVSYPLLGSLMIKGLTTAELEAMISRQLVDGKFLKEAHVTVGVTQFKSLRVSFLGEVNHPGQISLESNTSLLEAIAMAGGIAQTGGDRVVLIRMASGKAARMEYLLPQLIANPDSEAAKAPLVVGDIIYVPKGEQYYVYGEVNRPGANKLDRPTTVMQALAMMGGPTLRASATHPTLFRQKADGSVQEMQVKLTDLIQDGDVIYVKEALF